MANENPYLLVLNPKTKEDYAVTEADFVANEMGDQGFRVDRYQDGRRYEGSLPKVTPAQRESLNLPPPTPERMTVAGAEAAAAAKQERADARKGRSGTNQGSLTAGDDQEDEDEKGEN